MEISPDFVALCNRSMQLERNIARCAGRQLNEAIKSNIQDIETLDNIADALYDSMNGLSGAGRRSYLKYIKYLETFSPKIAKERKDSYEDSMGYKNHAVYAAARLAKEIHKGQVDKAGKDYFEEHLLFVACNGFNWKEKVVGLLHDAAEDTSCAVKDIIRALKKILNEWKKNPNAQEWQYEFDDLLVCFPNEKYHPLTQEEWTEITESLNLMNSLTAPDRETYIKRFRGHMLAIKVKLYDLTHNMDITRIPHPTEKDYARVERYKSEYKLLMEMLDERGCVNTALSPCLTS